MDNNLHQIKHNVLTSIMSNPKLARTFKEAMKAPIGSTKRDQARSILSIMRKVGGDTFSNTGSSDGQGGLFSIQPMTTSAPSTPTPTIPYAPDYSNLMVFPAAPALKKTNNTVNSSNITYPLPKDLTTPAPTQSTNWFDTAWNDFKGLGSGVVNGLANDFGSNLGSTLSKKVASSAIPGYGVISDLLSSVSKTTPTNSTPVTQGAGSKILNTLPKIAGGVVAGTEAALMGLGQFAGQNTIQAGEDALNWWNDSNQQIPKSLQPGYVSLQDTAGQKFVKDMWDSAGLPSSGSPAVANNVSASSPVIPNPSITSSGTSQLPVGSTPQTADGKKVLTDLQTYLVQNGYMTQAQAQAEAGTNGTVTAAVYAKAYADEQSKTTGGNTAGSNFSQNNSATGGQAITKDSFTNALIGQEGASYTTVNKDSGALGKYQIMPFNLSYAGLTNTPQNIQTFLNSPDLQDKAFQAMMSDLSSKNGGDPAKMAAAYYGGQTGAQNYGTPAGDVQGKYNKDGSLTGYPSVNEYVASVLNRASGGTSSTGSATQSVQNAVATNMGAENFAMGYANDKFGGGLDQYVQALDKKLKDQFNLPALEQQLSNLKDTGADLIPTLQTYMAGRDTYLKSIDAMIQTTQDKLSTLDASDPRTMSLYNLQMNNLYDLKGKQEGRYQNFLNSAVSDYNADLSRVESAVTKARTDYANALNSQGTMAQNDYNNLYTRMVSAYTALQNAPVVLANQKIALQQLGQSNLNTVSNGLGQSYATNPKLQEDQDKWTKDITIGGTKADSDSLNFTSIPANGLIGLYQKNADMGSDPRALTEAIRRALVSTLDNNPGNTAVYSKVKKLITDLASNPQGKDIADSLSNGIISSSNSSLSSYTAQHISDVQSAVNSLIKGMGWFGTGKSGIQDKAGWLAKYKNLDTDYLNRLYDFVNSNIGTNGSYAKNPSDFLNQVFPSGATDKQKADIIAAGLSVQ